MFIEIDFNSDEAIYVQLRNQIILGIATEQLKEGESLPSVRALAEDIGINMHTVNKAYATLKQDGFLKVDRRRGAVIAIDIDKLRSMSNMREYMKPIVARGMVKGISKEEAMQIVSDLYDELS
ncbi:MAG: GntR family transcriptional regulator [Lachnospiraceae bacterium]|nr:GntR family transcriptional regulator [Lachnospiraceae bacterium]MBR6349867.1 GntR family transcriptional regulator [Lachnospiraceae bacterium]